MYVFAEKKRAEFLILQKFLKLNGGEGMIKSESEGLSRSERNAENTGRRECERENRMESESRMEGGAENGVTDNVASNAESKVMSGKQGRFIDPLVDWGFKRIFGTEANKELLIEFLNDLFEGEREITDVLYLNNELPPDYPEGKGCLFDLVCRDKYSGQLFLMEMQNGQMTNFTERALYYTCRLFALEKRRGEKWQDKISGVYTVCLLNFKLNGNEKLRTDVELYDIQEGKRFYDNFKIVYIQLPCLKKEVHYTSKTCTNLERWLYLLKDMGTMDKYPEIIESSKQALRRLLEVCDLEKMSEKDRYQYEVALHQHETVIAVYETYRDEGLKEGRKEGLAQGIEQGIEQGMKKGMKQGMEKGMEKAKLETAKAMKNKNIAPDVIAECTGLSMDVIESL